MKNDLDVKTVGIVGCGVIGMSWAAYFLAKGFSVRANDPNADAEARMIRYIDDAWPLIEAMGLEPGAARDRLFFSTDLATALDGVDFVQENGPERLDLKLKLFKDMSGVIRPDVLIASSSSGTRVSDFQTDALHPERVLLGHPFNPPHIVPLVEVAGGGMTSADNVAKAMRFYAQIGKKPIRMEKEMKGHIANRLQAAVFREVLYLLDEGVASLEDIDIAIAHGPGLRWAILGHFLNAELGGGDGGIRHLVEHLGPALEAWWADLGVITHFSPEHARKMAEGVGAILERQDAASIAKARDNVLQQLLIIKQAEAGLPY